MKTLSTLLFLNHTSGLGGGEHQLLEILEGLSPDRHRVIVAASGRGPLQNEVLSRRADYLPLPESGWFSTSLILNGKKIFNPLAFLSDIFFLAVWIRKIFRILKAAAPDLVFTNSMFAHFAGLVISRRLGVPCVVYLHDILKAPQPIRSFASRWLSGRASVIICNSEATMESLGACAGEARREIIYPAVKGMAVTPGEMRGARELFSCFKQGRVIACAGRLTYGKGQADLLLALGVLRDRYPDLQVLLIGDAALGSRDYRKELERLSARLGIRERVTFAGYRNDVPALMAASQIVVVPSRLPEPFGRVALEALWQGKPVVLSRSGGLKEIVRHEETGLFFEPGNHKELASCLERLLENPQWAASLGSRGKEDAETRFSIEAFHQRIRMVLTESVSGQAAQRVSS